MNKAQKRTPQGSRCALLHSFTSAENLQDAGWKMAKQTSETRILSLAFQKSWRSTQFRKWVKRRGLLVKPPLSPSPKALLVSSLLSIAILCNEASIHPWRRSFTAGKLCHLLFGDGGSEGEYGWGETVADKLHNKPTRWAHWRSLFASTITYVLQ